MLKRDKIWIWISLEVKSSILFCKISLCRGWKSSVRKVFLKISQNKQENTCARAFFLIKLQALGVFCRKTPHRSFPVNLAKFFRALFFIDQLWLLLCVVNIFWVIRGNLVQAHGTPSFLRVLQKWALHVYFLLQ